MLQSSNISVLLVVPPFYAYAVPSLATATLKGALSERNISSKVLYANAQYANIIGQDQYRLIMTTAPFPELPQEHIFASSAHKEIPSRPLFINDSSNFYDRYYKMIGRNTDLPPQLCLDVIEKTHEFLDMFVKTVRQIQPKIIGFSSLYFQINSTLAMAQSLKKALPDSIIIMGGSNCLGEMGEEFAKQDCIDYVFQGEADTALPIFCADYLNNGTLPQEKLIECLPVRDLDTLPIPDYSDYTEQFTKAERADIPIYFEGSRGCWWGVKSLCKFCSFDDEMLPYRAKTPERLIAELRQFEKEYPENKSYFACDAVFPMSSFDDFFQLLSSKEFKGSFFYSIKPNLSFSQLKIMKENGFDTLGAGIESFSTKHLKMMKKGSTAATNIILLRNCKELNINVAWNHLVALPEDKIQDYKNLPILFSQVQHLSPPVIVAIYISRFSPYFEKYKENGISNIRPMDGYYKEFSRQINIRKLAYTFNAEIESETRKNPEALMPFLVELRKWRKRWRENQPELLLKKSNGNFLVRDTRDCAVEEETEISEEEFKILKDCRTAKNPAKIKGKIQNLLDRSFLINIDDKLLSIVCEEFDCENHSIK